MKKLFKFLAITALLSAVSISCGDKSNITGITISKENLLFGIGQSETLSASLLPYNATDKMKWSTNDNSVVLLSVENEKQASSVSKCILTAKKEGTAIVTVSTKDGKYSASCNVKVINAEPELIWVEGGTFTMGCLDGDCSEYGGEEPAHEVTVSGFNIAKYPVTQEQWSAIMGNNQSYCLGEKHPVERVSWDDIQVFIQKLNTITGKNYRLLTEAEWEYAARGGKKNNHYKFSGSNNADAVAWYEMNSSRKSHPVGTKAPNELGIYDMSGNVWEWCSDWYAAYSGDPQTNPAGPSSGKSRIIRGGCYVNEAQLVRVSYRSSFPPNYINNYMGFRLAHP